MEIDLRKRKALPSTSKNHGSGDEDPFASSDNDKDTNYVDESASEESISTPNKRRKLNLKKKTIKQGKQLTAKDRIVRLKNKFVSKSKKSKEQNNETEHSSVVLAENVKENLDYMFGDDDSEKVPQIRSDENTIVGPSCQQTESPNDKDITTINQTSALLEMNRMIIGQVSTLVEEVISMRKQLARMEAKGTFGQECSEKIETFIDFDAEMAMEGLPLKTIDAVIDLEGKLRMSTEYRKKLVFTFFNNIYYYPLSIAFANTHFICYIAFQIGILSIINGLNSKKKGHQIVTSIVDAIIHPQIQSLYTWTGKSGEKSTKKHAFDELKEMVSLIHATCMRTDPSYSSADCKKDLTYKVLKYSSSRWREIENKLNNKTISVRDHGTVIMSTTTVSLNDRGQSNTASINDSDTNYKPIDHTSMNEFSCPANTSLLNNFDANKMISTFLLPILTNLQKNTKQN